MMAIVSGIVFLIGIITLFCGGILPGLGLIVLSVFLNRGADGP